MVNRVCHYAVCDRSLLLTMSLQDLNAWQLPNNRAFYLWLEVDEVIDAWNRLAEDGTEDEMALFVERILRVLKTEKVTRLLHGVDFLILCYPAQHASLCEKWAEAKAQKVKELRLQA